MLFAGRQEARDTQQTLSRGDYLFAHLQPNVVVLELASLGSTPKSHLFVLLSWFANERRSVKAKLSTQHLLQ